MATSTKPRPVVNAARRPSAGANFERRTKTSAKSARKAVRKGLIRANVKNKVIDARLAARERAAFYANLRSLKMRRRSIATEMGRLASMVSGLQREVQTIEDRYPDVDAGLVEETLMLTKNANASVSAAADEMHTFSRRKVLFTEVAAAA